MNHDSVAELTYKAKGLGERIEYEFHEAAQNKAGFGPWSDPSDPVTLKEPVGKLKSSLCH